MKFSPQALLQRLQALPAPLRYLVAFSGGLDSSVLVHALHLLRQETTAGLECIHLDHGLSAASAAWADHSLAFCRARGIPCVVVRLALDCASGESLEACAREARYHALAQELGPGDAVLMAHHADDQAETVLLHLLRGSGLDGLSAMPAMRPLGAGALYRPLLEFDRRALEDYARAESLHWIEDHSNRDTRFDRNYIRHRVMPVLRARWPAAATTMVRSANHCAEAGKLIGREFGEQLDRLATGARLDARALTDIPLAGQSVVLRQWLRSLGLPLPDHRRLAELQRQLANAGRDRVPLVAWRGAEVRCWRGHLFGQVPLLPMAGVPAIAWTDPCALSLPVRLGVLIFRGSPLPDGLEVRFRRNGDRCKNNGINIKVKKKLQQLGIPPWLRDRVPLVFRDDALVAIGDYIKCDAWPDHADLEWRRGSGWPLDPPTL